MPTITMSGAHQPEADWIGCNLEESVRLATERLASHPFAKAAAAQQLDRPSLWSWILCAGTESRAFPDLLRGALATANGRLRDVITANLADELGEGEHPGSHFSHYLDLLTEIGIDRKVFDHFVPGGALGRALGIGRAIAAGGSLPEIYGYLLVNESATGPIYRAMECAARRLYPNLRSAFFDLHVNGDVLHVRDLMQVAEDFRGQASAVADGLALGEQGLSLVLDEAAIGESAAQAFDEGLQRD